MRQMNYKQDLANRITESVLNEMGLKHSSRRRALKENREQEILDKVHSMRSNIFDLTEEGYGVLYIDYDPQTNELYAGGATNAGIIKEYSVDYDDSQSLDYNLEGLYDEILQSPPTDDTMDENKKRIRKIVSEALRKRLNEIGDTNRGQYMLGRLAGRKYANNHDEKGYDESGKIAKYAQQQKQYKSVYNPYTSGYDNGFEGNDGQEGYDYYKEMDENKNRIGKFDRIVKESVKRVIKESLNSYAFHCYIPGLGNTAMLIDNISDAFPYINKAEYWDITKGSNSSEPSNLVAWGGESGYWSNIMNDPETNTRLKELILSKKKN